MLGYKWHLINLYILHCIEIAIAAIQKTTKQVEIEELLRGRHTFVNVRWIWISTLSEKLNSFNLFYQVSISLCFYISCKINGVVFSLLNRQWKKSAENLSKNLSK